MTIFDRALDTSRPPLVMGVVNLSPDSFYPASRVIHASDVLVKVEAMIDEGADLVDIGAESTRPGSHPLAPTEEMKRFGGIISEIKQKFQIPVSVDTYKPEVARYALDQGADIINDIKGMGHPDMGPLIAQFSAGIVIMHMRGVPETMQENIHYENCLHEVQKFLREAIHRSQEFKIEPKNIWIDPGIGFGKTLEHNLEIIAGLTKLSELGKPVVLGVSRKAFIGKLLDLPPEERLEGSLAAGLMGIMNGARVLRVHDIAGTIRAARIFHEINKRKN